MLNLNKFISNSKLAQKIQTERQDILPPSIWEILILFNILEVFITWRLHLTDITTLSERLININPLAPVAQKIADELVFRHFQGEGVEFFLNQTSLTPSDF